jgi:cytochrome c oxidase subunit 2
MRGLVTVESVGGFDAWLRAQSDAGKARYDAADTDAHWGWPWT